MLNYLWMALLAIGILAGIGSDIATEVTNPYRNGAMLEATFVPDRRPGPMRTSWEGEVVIPGPAFSGFYGIPAPEAEVRQRVSLTIPDLPGTLAMTPDGAAPVLWQSMARAASTPQRLAGTVTGVTWSADSSRAVVRWTFEPIRFVRLRAITQACFDAAGAAVTLAFGLIGVMALWLGVMKVAEAAGMLAVVARVLAPVMRRLFPDVPADHPAVSAMIMNIAANMLGLSNAATPLGLKAMEELNKLNPRVGTATNAMVTFLAINTGGLILIPATVLAVRSASGSANPGIIIGTSILGALCATAAGVLAARLLQRLPRYRMEDPGHE